jgi:hypothetical protein
VIFAIHNGEGYAEESKLDFGESENLFCINNLELLEVRSAIRKVVSILLQGMAPFSAWNLPMTKARNCREHSGSLDSMKI